MRVLITGGAGYVGSALCETLLKDDSVEHVSIYDNLSRKNYNLFLRQNFPKHKLSFIQGELLDSRKLKSVIKNIDVIYHLAAKVSTPFASEDPHFFEQVNHWGTAELVYAIEETGGVQRLIYTSSTSVYGASEDELNEGSPTQPKTYYGISKLRAEEHVRRLSKKMPAYIIRLGNVYGFSTSMRFDAVINRFLFEANYNRRINIQGSGKQERPFVEIRQVSEVLSKLAKHQLEPGTYNLVDQNCNIEELSALLHEFFPELESLYTNQHIKMRQLRVKEKGKLYHELPWQNIDMKQAMKECVKAFSF